MHYKVALIGCGWVGLGVQLDELRPKPASHTEAVLADPNTELCAFFDNQQESLDLAEKLYPEIPRYKDFHQLLREVNPEIVVIATNPESHCYFINSCAEYPSTKAILSEKPISHHPAEARTAVEVCKNNDTLLFVNHQRRFDHLIRRYRDYVTGVYVKDTYIGQIKIANAYYDKGLFHGGTHIVDLLCYFLGEPEWVTATRNTQYQELHDDINVDGMLGFSESTATIQVFQSSEYAIAEMSIFGERGRLNLKNMWGQEIETIGFASCKNYSAYRELDYKNANTVGKPRGMLADSIRHVVDCLQGLDIPLSTGDEALKVLEILFALKKSSEQDGKKIFLS
jgi:predicted dehydrogenase